MRRLEWRGQAAKQVRTLSRRPIGRRSRAGGQDKRPEVCVALIAGVLLLTATSASAAISSPGWTIDSFATPTNFSLNDNAQCLARATLGGSCDAYEVTATNAGSQSMDGSNVTLTDTLPPGVTIQEVTFFWSGAGRAPVIEGFPALAAATDLGATPLFKALGLKLCSTTPTTAMCHLPTGEIGALLGLSFPAIAPDDTLRMVVYVTVDENASGTLTNSAAVSGGGAPEASTSPKNEIASTPPPFGPANFNFYIDGLDGAPDSQAGDHPYELTTTISLNNEVRLGPEAQNEATSVHDLKDVVVDLPLGFVGSTLAAPECTLTQLSSEQHCPSATQVGHILTRPQVTTTANSPIWNLVPEHGVAGEFGYVDLLKAPHVFYARVAPTPAGYVLEVTNPDIPQVTLTHIIVTFFGNPAARDGTGNAQIPFFTNPTDCSVNPVTGEPERLKATIHMDSWQHPGSHNADGTADFSDPNWVSKVSESPAVTGCNELQFTPELKAQPTTNVADSPSGLEFEMKLPQTEDAGMHATPALKRAVVTLPEGMTVDPSAGNGLAACSTAQIGWLGGSSRNFNPAPPECPEASKIGSLELTTPLMPGVLTGSIYLATQNDNPFQTLLAGYIVVDDPATGVVIKLPGRIDADPHTGRLTAVFDENPQLPFSDLKLHFFGGPRAALATPESCGTFTTTSDLTPWSAPDTGPAATPSDNFQIDSGCVSGFAPSSTAGSTNTQAGAYTPFGLSFSRSDTDQELSGLSVTLPPGLLAKVARVPLCSDVQLAAAASSPSGAAEAANPSCPAGSQVGTVQAGAGPGPNPFFTSGKAYLTGPYKGAPYGLAVVVPAIAGPFDLGNVVVRSSLQIDPTDGHVTATSDPFPTILKGIPLRVRRIDVTLDRSNFTFNPTSCAPMAITGTLSSTGGLSAPVSSRFQASGCGELPFKPALSVSTQAKTSKANGASLTVKLSQIPGEANIRKVNLQLPIALPSRLTTLQKACTEAQFNANPAGCPPQSFIGTAKAVTPVLATPLTGPAILVSHGGAAFPDVEFLLQSEGVQITLDGKTDIKKGITYSRFETVPDAPITSFETILPQGPHSVLAANLPANAKASICGQKLVIPTILTGQNGATLTQTTKIAVTGCPKAKTRAQLLAAALKACKKKPKGKRAACAKQARKKYGPVKKTAKKKK
jgi:uncharacterized repeat protein (TIGR01451 family)